MMRRDPAKICPFLLGAGVGSMFWILAQEASKGGPVGEYTLLSVICAIAGTVTTVVVMLVKHLTKTADAERVSREKMVQNFTDMTIASQAENSAARRTFENSLDKIADEHRTNIAKVITEHKEDRETFGSAIEHLTEAINRVILPPRA